jgi:hypothetical protein
MIVASAVRLTNGSVFVGKRHGDCYEMIKYITEDKESCKDSMQGFITDKLEFLDREDAYFEAVVCKQCEEKEYAPSQARGLFIPREQGHPVLFSEDLW